MSKELVFFAYLIESFAAHRGCEASDVLAELDRKGLTEYVYDMYEMYHQEALENAFADIESLLATGRPAW